MRFPVFHYLGGGAPLQLLRRCVLFFFVIALLGAGLIWIVPLGSGAGRALFPPSYIQSGPWAGFCLNMRAEPHATPLVLGTEQTQVAELTLWYLPGCQSVTAEARWMAPGTSRLSVNVIVVRPSIRGAGNSQVSYGTVAPQSNDLFSALVSVGASDRIAACGEASYRAQEYGACTLLYPVVGFASSPGQELHAALGAQSPSSLADTRHEGAET